jgi:hypothetical protein
VTTAPLPATPSPGIRDRYMIHVDGAPDLSARRTSPTMSTRSSGTPAQSRLDRGLVPVRDTYGVQIAPGQEDTVILAGTVCVDSVAGG